jgi:hypothetical protein
MLYWFLDSIFPSVLGANHIFSVSDMDKHALYEFLKMF